VAVPDSGPLLDLDSGPDGGIDAGDGGYHSDGGCFVGERNFPGGVVPAGEWEAVQLGSCTVCDPTNNPNGFTVVDAGAACQGFGALGYGEPLTVPFEGVCGFDPPFGKCGGAHAGTRCNLSQGLGCQGGFCNTLGWCEVTQNLAGFTACGWVDSIPSNSCADGPCCWDGGGYPGVVPDGGGWCCGLVDGGVPNCLSAGDVCVMDSNCCTGLHCTGPERVLPGDSGSGSASCE
jgi:hypothetical protein